WLRLGRSTDAPQVASLREPCTRCPRPDGVPLGTVSRAWRIDLASYRLFVPEPRGAHGRDCQAATMLFGLAACNGRPNELASSSSHSPVSGSTRPAAYSDTSAVRHRGGHRGATGGGLVAVHDPGRVTGMLIGPCRARDHGMLPDPSCTPGTVDSA